MNEIIKELKNLGSVTYMELYCKAKELCKTDREFNLIMLEMRTRFVNSVG